MATTYIIFHEVDDENGGVHHSLLDGTVEAANAAQARVIAAKGMREDYLDRGVTLIAVPERNWRTGRGTLKAETQRRIRSA